MGTHKILSCLILNITLEALEYSNNLAVAVIVAYCMVAKTQQHFTKHNKMLQNTTTFQITERV